jgi:magnesium-transporting ATPase (P-type)
MGGLAEGRRIVSNVEKGLIFLTSTHVAMLGFILLATFAGFAHPLLPLQILWLELFIDIAASVAFEREPPEPDVMTAPPRPRHRPLLTRAVLVKVAIAGGVTAAAALLLIVGGGGTDHARWLAFNALVFGQLARAWANRSLRFPVARLPLNRLLAAACLASVAVQLAIPFVPPLADAFHASVLAPQELLLVGLIAIAPATVAQVVRSRSARRWVA